MLHKVLKSLDDKSDKKFHSSFEGMTGPKHLTDKTRTLGIESFIISSVRPFHIAIMISFFENSEMEVKCKGLPNTSRSLLDEALRVVHTHSIVEYLSKQAGAELCQAQHSLSVEQHTN